MYVNTKYLLINETDLVSVHEWYYHIWQLTCIDN